MLRSMCNNFRKWKSSYRVFIVFFVRFGFHIYPGRLFKAVCAGCGTSGDTIFFRFSDG